MQGLAMCCHFVRVDDTMQVSHYLAHQTGGRGSVSVDVHRADSPVFKLSKDQFDHVFSEDSHEAPH